MPDTHEGMIFRFDVDEIEEIKIDPIKGYDERPIEWFRERILPDLLTTKERLNLGENVIDIGCAMGYFSKIIAEHFGKVTGIDFAPTRIALAKQHNAKENIEYLLVDLVTDEKIPGRYDWAYSSAVFQHIRPDNDDRVNAFRKTFEVIPSGSYLVLYDESFDVRKHIWDGFYMPLSPKWIRDNLSSMCELTEFEPVAGAHHGESEFRYVMRKI